MVMMNVMMVMMVMMMIIMMMMMMAVVKIGMRRMLFSSHSLVHPTPS